jgi:hypothetical protein
VLSTPPAFVLSQDQTLREELLETGREATRFTKSRQRSHEGAQVHSGLRSA